MNLYESIKTNLKEEDNPINKIKLKESTKEKRIARYREFDNGHVLHSWKEMSDEEAEEAAKQASIKDPTDVYYVAYDDVMNPGSELRWYKGKSYTWDEVEEVLKKEKEPFLSNHKENSTLKESIDVNQFSLSTVSPYYKEIEKHFRGDSEIKEITAIQFNDAEPTDFLITCTDGTACTFSTFTGKLIEFKNEHEAFRSLFDDADYNI